MNYSQKLECMIEALNYLPSAREPLTARHLTLLKESTQYDSFAEGLVSGLWTGYLSAKGLVSELEGNVLSVSEQIDELIEYMGE